VTALPEVPALERPPVDWERHRGDKRPKILPPPGETWRNPGTNRKIGHRYYTRVTTYADAITEAYNLTAWKLRRLALGLGQRADYVRLAAAYTDRDEDRDALDELVAKALEAAGPNRADLGTALHALAERLDRGEDLGTPPDEVLPDLAAYTALVDGVLAYVHREARTVCDELECAGTPDGHAYVAEDPPTDWGPRCDCPAPVLRIVDTKTGSIRYPGKMSTQLAIYAHSDLYDPATGERIPVDVCPHWGVIVHLPVETGEAALYWLDLVHGWHGAQLCGPVREWHRAKADDILRPFAGVQPVKIVDGEVTRREVRPASWKPQRPTTVAPEPVDLTDALAASLDTVAGDDPETVRDEWLDGEPEVEPRVPEDVVDVTTASGKIDPLGPYPVSVAQAMQPDGRVLTETRRPGRCLAVESESDPAAPRCELAAGHPDGHRFERAVVPVERCPVTELRVGECACRSCRPDLAAVDDAGVEPDPGPTEIPEAVFETATATGEPVSWPGVDDYSDPLTDGDEPDQLADEIARCITTRDLELLSSKRWRDWSQRHRDLAVEVHDRLEAAERAAKPRAAFEAALAAATTTATVEAAVGAATGQPWLDDELLNLAGARWHELRAAS
jgi:hypothetical protein